MSRGAADGIAFAAFLCWAIVAAKLWDVLIERFGEKQYAACISVLLGILVGTTGFLFQATWPIPLIAQNINEWAALLTG